MTFRARTEAAAGTVSRLIGSRFGLAVVSGSEGQNCLSEGRRVEREREVALPSEALELGLRQPVRDFVTGGEDRSVRVLAI